jgi:hypothetical protein
MNAASFRSHTRLKVESLEDRCLPSSSSYVSALYTGLLERPGSDAEVAGWVAQLDGGVPPAALTTAFTTSPEFLTNLVEADYQAFLQRTPTPVEVQGWLNQLENGLSPQQLEASFLGSAEFFALHGNNDASWLEGVYQSLLGRDAGSADQAVWLPQLQGGLSLPSAASQIVHSSEAAAREVAAAYEQLLGRAPDAAGLAYWVGQLAQGLTPAQLDAQLAASAEFINLHGSLDAVEVASGCDTSGPAAPTGSTVCDTPPSPDFGGPTIIEPGPPPDSGNCGDVNPCPVVDPGPPPDCGDVSDSGDSSDWGCDS